MIKNMCCVFIFKMATTMTRAKVEMKENGAVIFVVELNGGQKDTLVDKHPLKQIMRLDHELLLSRTLQSFDQKGGRKISKS